MAVTMRSTEREPDVVLERAQRILRLAPRFSRWATMRVSHGQPDHGLNLPQLVMLYRIGEGTTSSAELARRLLVTPALVTKLIDRLVQRGYVLREPDPHDRRRLRLVLTAAGQQVSQTVELALAEELAARLALFSAEEFETLGHALELLERALAPLEVMSPTKEITVGPDATNQH